jgi:hypothetical protein
MQQSPWSAPPAPGLTNLDPVLFQQVMSLIPQPNFSAATRVPIKQQSILALRQLVVWGSSVGAITNGDTLIIDLIEASNK